MKGFILNTELSKSPDNVGLDANQLTTDADYFTKLNCPGITIEDDTPTNTSTIPTKAGDIYIDTTNSKVYIAKAATAESDFLILN